MLIGWALLKYLWAEAIGYAVWLKNRLPSRSIPGHTPHTLIYNERPNLSLAKEFGSWVLVHAEGAGKLEPRADDALFVGVDTQSKGYRVYWEGKRHVSVERNMMFIPQTVDVTDGVPVEGESSSSPVSKVST